MRLSVDKLGKVAITVEENYWSLEKDYDKLTIVEQEGVFGTFISRKPVPAGTVLTDRKYWIPFSSLKEEIIIQFNEIVNELRELEVSVDEKEAEIYKAIASIVAGGVALKQSFGDSEEFGISQKVLTESRDNLQAQIDEIVSGGATINLTATPSPVFVGVSSTINLSATTNKNATNIKIKKGVDVLSVGSGSSLSGTDTINPSTAGNITYTAEFTISGLQRSTTRNVVAVYPIRIGSGATYTEGTVLNTPKTSPAGTYNVIVSNNEDYVWFNVPSTMTINGATMSGFDFPLETPVDVTIGGVAYKSYQSSNTYDAGSLTIVIS